MKRIPKRHRLVLLVLCASLGGGLVSSGASQERGRLQKFMRQKLEHAQNVLEGLTVEDFTLIANSARRLREVSEDARWRVSPSATYLRISNEFQDVADEMHAKAKQRNLDGATLAYVKLTMTCVKCHKLVREEHLTSPGPGEEGRGRR
jgi:cytochrome c556